VKPSRSEAGGALSTALSGAGGPRQFSIRHRETPQNGARVPCILFPRPHLASQTSNGKSIGQQVLGYLRVSHPWFEVTKPIRQLIFDLSLGSALMLLPLLSGWFPESNGAGA